MFEFILANFALHVKLDPVEKEMLQSKLQRISLKKNKELLRPGEICRNIYFVDHGCLRMFNRDQAGEEHNILFCPENWWAADMASFSAQTPAYYNISALEDTDVFYLSYVVLEQLYAEIPKLERFFRILSQTDLVCISVASIPICQKQRRNVMFNSNDNIRDWDKESLKSKLHHTWELLPYF